MADKSNGYGDRGIILKSDCLIKTKMPKIEQYYTTRTKGGGGDRLIRKIRSVWEGISKGGFIQNDLNWKRKNCAYYSVCTQWFSGNLHDEGIPGMAAVCAVL